MTGGGVPDVGEWRQHDVPCPVGCGGLGRHYGQAPCVDCTPAGLVPGAYADRDVDELARWLLAAIADDAVDLVGDRPELHGRHEQRPDGWCTACRPGTWTASRLTLNHEAVMNLIIVRGRLAHAVAAGHDDVELRRRFLAPVVTTLFALALGPYRDRGGCPVDLP